MSIFVVMWLKETTWHNPITNKRERKFVQEVKLFFNREDAKRYKRLNKYQYKVRLLEREIF